MFGFLNVYKPKGITSHDVVSILRRVTKIKQIGHTGTLDPFAEGVLPICIGKATKLIEYLNDEKAYVGTIQLGSSTSTYDTEGEITKTSNKIVSIKDIEASLKDFQGDIEQIPPIYSAIKVNGKKLYEYAREGKAVDIKPRKVTINNIKIEKFDSDSNQLEVFIDCSKGTYIRSIANDLGEKLGTYGHLIKLVRIKAGDFYIENSINLQELNSVEIVQQKLIQPLDYLTQTKYELSEEEFLKVSHGNPLNIKGLNGIILLVQQNVLAGVGYADGQVLKCKRVFI